MILNFILCLLDHQVGSAVIIRPGRPSAAFNPDNIIDLFHVSIHPMPPNVWPDNVERVLKSALAGISGVLRQNGSRAHRGNSQGCQYRASYSSWKSQQCLHFLKQLRRR
jgi:hypothetical protein